MATLSSSAARARAATDAAAPIAAIAAAASSCRAKPARSRDRKANLSRLDGSSTQSIPAARSKPRNAAGEAASNGRSTRTVGRSTTPAMPASPAEALPRSARCATVSA